MLAFLAQHPRFLPGLLFTATLAAQAALVLLLRKRGLPRYGKAPTLPVPIELILLVIAAVALSAVTLGGFWFDLVALGGVVAVIVGIGLSPARHFGLAGAGALSPLRAVGLGLLIALAVGFPLQVFATGIEKVFRHFGLPTPPEPAVALFLAAHDPVVLAKLLFAALVVAPLCEEVFFRGFLHSALKAHFPTRPSIPLCATAAVFAAIHCHWATLLPLFGFALALGLVYELSGSLLLCLAVHFWFNAITALSLLADLATNPNPLP